MQWPKKGCFFSSLYRGSYCGCRGLRRTVGKCHSLPQYNVMPQQLHPFESTLPKVSSTWTTWFVQSTCCSLPKWELVTQHFVQSLHSFILFNWDRASTSTGIEEKTCGHAQAHLYSGIWGRLPSASVRWPKKGCFFSSLYRGSYCGCRGLRRTVGKCHSLPQYNVMPQQLHPFESTLPKVSSTWTTWFVQSTCCSLPKWELVTQHFVQSLHSFILLNPPSLKHVTVIRAKYLL